MPTELIRSWLRSKLFSRLLRVGFSLLPARDINGSAFSTPPPKIAHWSSHRLQHVRELMRAWHVFSSPTLRTTAGRLYSTSNAFSNQTAANALVQPLLMLHALHTAHEAASTFALASTAISTAVALTPVVKRPVGRPRKNALLAPITVVSTEANSKRRGRPPKATLVAESKPSIQRKKEVKDSPVAAAPEVTDPFKKARRTKSASPSLETTKTAVRPRTTARKSSSKTKLPARLNMGSSKHWDLSSYLAYQEQRNADPESGCYKGTHFEYTTMEALQAWGFSLSRKGKAGDRGIDLCGTWTLPDGSGPKVIISCKAVTPDPKYIRELAGSVNGAPAGWDHDRVMCLLVSSKEAKKGTFDAVDREHRPMGFLHITRDGKLMQLYTNNAAKDAWLTGVSATPRNKTVGGKVVQDGINFEWLGQPWTPSC